MTKKSLSEKVAAIFGAGLGLFADACGTDYERILPGEKIPPVAVIRPITPIEGKAPMEIFLSGFDSYDPDNERCLGNRGEYCLDFLWSLEKNGERQPRDDSVEFGYIFDKLGTYRIWLEVKDLDNLTNEKYIDVTVR